ncbi:glycosyltransferase [Streptomyces sp. AJS327]|uniref:glycosyltransferase n=1 Tax=Streptomyces sp. AJS327 TaxID=2545265 RepID=UPI001C609B34|nr:glycosyltransferase [Streptomyces sp. AJS327]
MDISALRNPYDYRNPVRDATVFAGRGEEVAILAYEMDQTAVDRPSVCVVLHGPRASGKTSLLNATEWLATERGYTTARVELIGGDGDPTVFFRKVYEELATAVLAECQRRGQRLPFDMAQLRRTMAGVTRHTPGPVPAAPEHAPEPPSTAERSGAETATPGLPARTPGAPARTLGADHHGPGAAEPLPEFVPEFPEAVALAGADGRVPEAALRADLASFVHLLGHPLVLLVDEAQLMAEDAQVLSILRFLTSRVDGLVLVLAGTSGLVDRITEVHSPILRQFREIAVSGFVEWEDVRNCVMRPLRSLGVHSMSLDGVVSALRQLTDGNPYEIQLYCHEMFARWQRGASDAMELTAEVLEGIRSRMESRQDVLARPLIRVVRAMEPSELVAFNVLTSALGHATADQAWFAYCLTGPPRITRAEYDDCRDRLVAEGVITTEGPVQLALENDLFDEIYARLWTVGKLGTTRHGSYTSRTHASALLTYRLLELLHGFAQEPLHIFPTCCHGMRQDHLDEIIRVLDTLPEEGPDAAIRINYLHKAILLAGEPRALDLIGVTCTFGELTVRRWLYAPDSADVALSEDPAFVVAAAWVAELGGELTTDHVRVPLRTWPATDWFGKVAPGQLRDELADNHLSASYRSYGAGDLPTARRHLEASYELSPGWEHANNLMYMSLSAGEVAEAQRWGERATGWTEDSLHRALTHYNRAMTGVLSGDRGEINRHLTYAERQLDAVLADEHPFGFLFLPDPDRPGALREETDVDLADALRRARETLGLPRTETAERPDHEPVLGAATAPPDEAPDAGDALPDATPVPGNGGADARNGASAAETGDTRARASEGGVPQPEAAEGGAAEGAAPDDAERPVILSVATEWDSSHGGLSTFNRDLCRALAAAGARVFCAVLTASAEEETAARAAGVTLLPAPAVAGASDDLRLGSRPALPEGTEPDVVVGHSRITGPVAKAMADAHFPAARRLHLIHMAPDEIEWYKPGRDSDAGLRAEERTDIERQLGRDAHRVVTVGPHLRTQFLAEFTDTEVLRLDPGFDVPAPTGPRTPPGGEPLRVLLLGRVEDARLKGVDLAAMACGEVARWHQEDELPPVRLVVRGARKDDVDADRARIVEWANSPRLDVVVRPYTSAQDCVEMDLNSASLLVMPSRSEGFGLVGVEAIVRGVPVLVSSESGLAQLLREALGQKAASRFVVEMSRDENDPGRWARAIGRKLQDRAGAFREIAECRARLAREMPWARAAAVVLEAALDRAPTAGRE